MQTAVLYPVAALVLLTVLMTLRSARLNFRALRSRAARPEQFRVFETGELPLEVMLTARNVSNLFEQPVLFYVLALFLCLFERVNHFYLAGAWLFVALRCAHSYVHVATDNLLLRYRLFAASCFLVWGLWAVFVGSLLLDAARR